MTKVCVRFRYAQTVTGLRIAKQREPHHNRHAVVRMTVFIYGKTAENAAFPHIKNMGYRYARKTQEGK